MEPFPVIETKRIRLRRPLAKDIPNIVEYANNPKIARTTLNIPYPYREKDAVFWIHMANQGFENKSNFVFAVCQLPHDDFIGGIGLRINKRFYRAELGYWIAEPFWNKGYATEASKEILKFGFEKIDLHKIYATHLVGNSASGKVMAKTGMIKEGELVDHIRKSDQYFSLIQYRLTKEEYFLKK